MPENMSDTSDMPAEAAPAAPLPITVFGAGGRMGRMLVQAVHEAKETSLAAATEKRGSPLVGTDAGLIAGVGELGVIIGDSPSSALRGARAAIDFTLPEASVEQVDACRQEGRAIVIGTTGFSAEQIARVHEAAKEIPVVHAPNMSVGVNLCFNLIRRAAEVLGEGVDIEIIEAHHRNKVDAPSGTAVRMGEIVAAATGRDLAKSAIYGRQGRTGVRERKTIGFETIRGGDIVGEHTVLFAGEGERLEIVHRSSSRANFAAGALRAACWAADRPAGLYDMQDVLGLR